jgi:hypothetical protein
LIDVRLWPIAAGYVAATVGQVYLPRYPLLVMSSAQLVLMGTVLFVWRRPTSS